MTETVQNLFNFFIFLLVLWTYIFIENRHTNNKNTEIHTFVNLYVLKMKLIVSWNGLQICPSGAFITCCFAFSYVVSKFPVKQQCDVMRQKREGQDNYSCPEH